MSATPGDSQDTILDKKFDFNPKNCDVVFVRPENRTLEVFAHCGVLTKHSIFFETLFGGEIHDGFDLKTHTMTSNADESDFENVSSFKVVKIKNAKDFVFVAEIIDFLYHGCKDVPESSPRLALFRYKISHKFGVSKLKSFALACLRNHLLKRCWFVDGQFVSDLIQVATEYDDSDLKSLVQSYWSQRFFSPWILLVKMWNSCLDFLLRTD